MSNTDTSHPERFRPAAPSKQSRIEPGGPEMELFLQAGYPGMTAEKAEEIIRERKEDPASWPYEEVVKAKAFLEALHATPTAVSTDKGWRRSATESY